MDRSRFHTRQTTFRQLEIFREVAERLSVTEAAHALHLAQPSVSTQLGKLEQALGLSLFEQIGKRLHLTDAGMTLMAQAECTATELEKDVSQRLTERERKTLMTLLQKIYL